MKKNGQVSKEGRYPFKMSRLYVNAATVILATFMAAVTLTETPLMLLFLALTSLISVVILVLKIRPVFGIRKLEDEQKDRVHTRGRREFYTLPIVIVIILLPFLLFFSAGSLPAYTWFLVLASLAAGIGISEILFYIYCKRVL